MNALVANIIGIVLGITGAVMTGIVVSVTVLGFLTHQIQLQT